MSDFDEQNEDDIKKNNQALFDRITALYAEGQTKDSEVFKDNIRLSPEQVRAIVGYLQKQI